MIVFPDAVKMSSADLYQLQMDALDQCGKLGDRVAIFDLHGDEATGANFRNGIGTSYLKYGAAYTPFLKSKLKKEIRYRDIYTSLSRGGVSLTLSELVTDPSVQPDIAHLDEAVADSVTVDTAITQMLGNFFGAPGLGLPAAETPATLEAGFELLKDRLVSTNNHTRLGDILDYFYRMTVLFDDLMYTTPLNNIRITGDVNLCSSFKAAITKVIAIDRGAESLAGTWTSNYNLYDKYNGGGADPYSLPMINWGPVDQNFFADPANAAHVPVPNIAPFGVDVITQQRLNVVIELSALFTAANVAFVRVSDQVTFYEKTYEEQIINQVPFYKNLIAELGAALTVLPPSGAIAGVYAQVDGTRGVWKAPANVSLSGVVDVTQHFTKSETDALNINTDFGKSINAIKFFTGMGFMVWGARTLAGNDNEWRYISVRRFFNMVEESVKKATMWAVFEPNDAGTWVKVKGMIDNFLTLQWRNGALQGTKMEFSEVSGLNIENQVVEYRDGLSPEFTMRKMPGIQKFGNITMKRGIFKKDNDFFKWLNTVKMNTIERRDLTIKLLDEKHAPVMVWKAINAFPVKVEGPGLKASGNEVAIESLEAAHEGLTIETT